MKSAEQWVKAKTTDRYTTQNSKVLLSEDDILEIQIDALKEAGRISYRVGSSASRLIDGLVVHLEAMAPWRQNENAPVGRDWGIK
jgi:hypothetical protein